MVKSTRLIPHQTVPQRESIIKFLHSLYLSRWVSEEQTLIYSDGLAEAQQSQQKCCRTAGRDNYQWSDLIRNRVEALSRAMCLPFFSTITLRTQVKNNLSWAARRICSEILGHFDQIVCKSCRGGNLAPGAKRERNDNLKSNFSSSNFCCWGNSKQVCRVMES